MSGALQDREDIVMSNTVNLARLYYPVRTLGYGERVGIWVAGCNRECPYCITPDLRDIGSGREVDVEEIMEYIRKYCNNVDGFTISGGEPFLNAAGLKRLVEALSYVSEDIIIYSGYTHKELVGMKDDNVDYVLDNISVLVDGPYIHELNDGKGLRGSSNQVVHVFKYEDRYKDFEHEKRSVQLVVEGDRVMTIGIP